MPRIVILMFLLFVPAAKLAAQNPSAYEYQGKIVGVTTFQDFSAGLTPDEVKRSHQSACAKPVKGSRKCVFWGKKVFDPTATYAFLDDKLVSVEVMFADIVSLEGYVKAVTEKYGTPTLSSSTLQNGFGATRAGRVWTWQNATGVVVIDEFGKNADIGTLTYIDVKLNAELKDRFTAKPVI